MPGEVVYKKDEVGQIAIARLFILVIVLALDILDDCEILTGQLEIYQIDGKVDKTYCQCLCLLGKLFIDHKTIMYDLDPFTFTVLARNVEGKKEVGWIDLIIGYTLI